MLSSFIFQKSHSISILVILLLCNFVTGCSSVGMAKENTNHDVATACDATSNASCHRKTIEELAELGESSKYSTYLNVGADVGNPLNIFLFSYDKTVKELVGLTTSLISIGLQEEEEKNDLVIKIPETSDQLNPESRTVATAMSDYTDVKTDERGHRQHFAQEQSVLLSQAYRFLGVPYRRGGTTPKGFDCSGLVYYLHKNIGISLPRTAHAQYLNSSPVAQSDLQAGDLVFFRTRRGTQRITHVGVYVGDNKFIHSRSPGKRVTITSLSDSYYRARFVRGGRV